MNKMLLFVMVALMVSLGSMFAQEEKKEEQEVENQMTDAEKKIMVTRHYSTGYEYYKNKMYLEAIEPLKKVVELNPKKMSAWSKLASSYQQLSAKYSNEGNNDLAAAYLDSTKFSYYQALSVREDYVTFHYMLGWIYLSTGNLDSAKIEYNRVVELDEEKPMKSQKSRFQSRKVLAEIAYKEEEYEEALDWYNAASEIEPDNQEVLKMIQEISEGMGDLEVVIEKLQQQLASNPKDTTILYKLAKTQMKEQFYEDAVKTLDSLVALTPKNTKHVVMLGKAYQSMDMNQKAIGVYKKVLRIDSGNKEALTEIAICYAITGDLAAAENYVCRALRSYPKYNRAIWNKAEIIERIAGQKLDEDGTVSYEGKFVYEKAREVYKRLFSDPELGRNAKNRYKYLKNLIRTSEDKFMHPNVKLEFGFGC